MQPLERHHIVSSADSVLHECTSFRIIIFVGGNQPASQASHWAEDIDLLLLSLLFGEQIAFSIIIFTSNIVFSVPGFNICLLANKSEFDRYPVNYK